MRLSTHSQDLGAALPFIRSIAPKYVVAIDPDPASAQAVFPALLIVRHAWRYDFGDGKVRDDMNAGITASQAALEFYHSCQQQGWWPTCWAILTPPAMAFPTSDPDLLYWAITFQADLVVLFRGAGKETVVCGVPTGHDGFLVPGASWYHSQEYGWGNVLAQDPWHSGRHTMWFPAILAVQPTARLFISECGVTALLASPPLQADCSAPHGSDVGFLGGYGIPAVDAIAYWESLKEYESELPSYVEGAFVFQVGGFADWATHEVLGSEIETLWLAHEPIPPEPPTGGEPMGPEIVTEYPAQFDAWIAAGGWKNFASFMVATGQVTATDAERRDLVLDRLESATKENGEFLRSLNLV